MAGEESQDIKLQDGLLQQQVETRARQIDSLLSKLYSTADRIVELTVEIKSLNSRQERHSKVDDVIRSELKLLHTRIGCVHDEIGQHVETRDKINSQWVPNVKVEGRWNRCVISDSTRWHCAGKFFGTTKETSRLTIVFFGRVL